ncbi:MAG: hypothetical protein KGL63_01030 [Betaproteobacteria bacterium]|nr:hypothetical protein [Betaproteobacteria bacterium]
MTSPKLSFLPETIRFSGDWNAFVALAYQVFKEGFLDSSPRFHSKRVSVNLSKKDGSQMEEGFWHLVTREDKILKERLPDFPRAERITWVRPIIENFSTDGMDFWKYLEGSGQIRYYLYARADDYLVILEEKHKSFFLVTGFYVDTKWKRKELENKKTKCIP